MRNLKSAALLGALTVLTLILTVGEAAARTPAMLRPGGPVHVTNVRHQLASPASLPLGHGSIVGVSGRNIRLHTHRRLHPLIVQPNYSYRSLPVVPRVRAVVYRDVAIQPTVVQQSVVVEKLPEPKPPKVHESPLVKVTQVLDGTRLMVQSGDEQLEVKLLGVRTAGELATKAQARLTQLLQNNYVVMLTDPASAKQEEGSAKLVILHPAGLNESVNVDLIRQGLAVTNETYSFTDQQYFLGVQAAAKAAKRGGWDR